MWDGEVEIAGELRRTGAVPPRLRVCYQPCDEARCLPPVAIEVE